MVWRILINIIKDQATVNTRKELWDNLFLVVDFSRMEGYYNMWNKEYRMLPLVGAYKELKGRFSEYCKKVNSVVEDLINSYAPYFNSEILPVLSGTGGDKTLLFRCKRLLDNKVIGESLGLFLDLVIWEVEWRQVEKFKEALRILGTEPMFLSDREDELFMSDCERMEQGKINYLLAQRFYLKWSSLVAKSGIQKEAWGEIGGYLKKWQAGKGAGSEWASNLKNMGETRDKVFMLGSESISDGLPFLGLGYIKKDSELGLEVVLQNRKGFNLNNPYVMVVWFHQKIVRVYVVRGYEMTDPKRLYVSLRLEEDWVWRDYPLIMNSKGEFRSISHSVYWRKNLN